ncbi:MAG TPA: hypothetical protein VGK38_13115 [Prolixibacteraceae bacterium]
MHRKCTQDAHKVRTWYIGNTTYLETEVGADLRKGNGWPIKRVPDISADREEGGNTTFGLRRIW